MNPLRLKVLTLAGATGFLVLLSLSLALSSRMREKALAHQIQLSLQIQSHLKGADANTVSDSSIQHLQTIREDVEPKERQLALSNTIQALSAKSSKLIRSRVPYFLESEIKYRSAMEDQQRQAQTRFDFWIMASGGMLLFNLLLLIAYLQTRIFGPVRRLSEQMIAFLNGQYSYRFDAPTADEMGNLQSTFNSMAQKVLNNLEELKALDRAKSDFLNIASHELRTPMTSIKGSLGLINSGVMGNLNPEVLSLMKIAEGETDRLIRLINDILDMAKIEAGRLPLKQGWFDLSDLLKNCSDSLHGLAETSKIRIEFSCSNLYQVYGDRDRIQQVLTNFLSNALKFSPEGSAVMISPLINRSSELQIEVTDQGRGISPEDQSQLFQKFRQATSAESPLVKGTGLGLAISKALIEQHGGHVGVRSSPGQGSTFYFSLPTYRLSEQNKVVEQDENLQVPSIPLAA